MIYKFNWINLEDLKPYQTEVGQKYLLYDLNRLFTLRFIDMIITKATFNYNSDSQIYNDISGSVLIRRKYKNNQPESKDYPSFYNVNLVKEYYLCTKVEHFFDITDENRAQIINTIPLKYRIKDIL